jgi:hypothetical protein
LYDELYEEFRDDLSRWNATLERDNTIRFNETEVLFESGLSDLQLSFQYLLMLHIPLVITAPWVGHATWRAYKGLVAQPEA